MSEFLVEIEVDVPADHPADDLARRRAAESARAAELAAAGHVVRLWRPEGPGWRNLGLWRADDEAALRAIIATLPMYEFMTLSIRALGAHPNDPGLRAI
ncbi:MAG: muconolactone Delta-isomerase family protein [Mycobacterium sp.]